MLYQVIYSSKAAKAMSVADLRAILEDARAGNEKRQVTGALVYADGVFLQILEGPRQSVQSLMRSIAADTRHTHVKVFHEAGVDHRVFGAWTMAYLDASEEQLAQWLGLPGTASIQQMVDELVRDATRTSEVAGRILRALAP